MSLERGWRSCSFFIFFLEGLTATLFTELWSLLPGGTRGAAGAFARTRTKLFSKPPIEWNGVTVPERMSASRPFFPTSTLDSFFGLDIPFANLRRQEMGMFNARYRRGFVARLRSGEDEGGEVGRTHGL